MVELHYEQVNGNPTIQLSRENTNTFTEFIETHQCIRDHKIHSQLQTDLVEHLWQLQGELWELSNCVNYACGVLL